MGELSGKRANERSLCLLSALPGIQLLARVISWVYNPGYSLQELESADFASEAGQQLAPWRAGIEQILNSGCWHCGSSAVSKHRMFAVTFKYSACSVLLYQCAFSQMFLMWFLTKQNLRCSWLEEEPGFFRPRLTCPALLFLQEKSSSFQLSSSKIIVTRLIGTGSKQCVEEKSIWKGHWALAGLKESITNDMGMFVDGQDGKWQHWISRVAVFVVIMVSIKKIK